jgi:lipoprotein-releasing system permease protein
MRTSFEWFVAFRYLRGARSRAGGTRFLRFVTAVAIGGVAVGVAALLLSLMVVRGFSREIQEKIVGFGSHVRVEHYLESPLTGADTLAARLAAFPGVERVTPVTGGFVLLRAGAEMEGIVLNGVPEGSQDFLAERLYEGQFTFAADTSGRTGVVLGRALADLLAVTPGDRVLGVAMRDYGGAGGLARPRVVNLYVSGIFETGLADFDRTFAYTSLEAARRLVGMAEDEVSRYDLTLASIGEAEATAGAISEALGVPILARSIYRVQANLFAWVNLQRSIIPLVIGVIVLVAAFNIIGLLLMVILEKTREIGIMRSMGAGARGVRRLFVSLGFLVGVVGTGAGLLLALALGVLQQRYGIIPLPQEAYYIDTAPVELHALDFVLVAAIAVALCTLSAYLPARVAARTEPVRAIRFASWSPHPFLSL